MSNPFYNYSGAFIPGILARAEAVAAEYQAVQAGFALLVVIGVDSGAANAYVVATQGQPTGSYTDGAQVMFKPLATNTGASTISVNSIAAAQIVRFNNTALNAGDIIAGAWVEVTYDATIGKFRLTGAGQTAVVSGTISAAPPVNKVGLVAAGGSAITVLPSDATWALDQSIAPTWTGAHVFSNTVALNAAATVSGGLTVQTVASTFSSATTFSGSVALNGAVTSTGGIVINAATGGAQGVGTLNALGLFVNGVAVETNVGANPTAKVGTAVVNGVATTFMRSDGAPPIDQSIAPTWTGRHIFTPASGVAVTVNGVNGSSAIAINLTASTGNNFLTVGNTAGSVGMDITATGILEIGTLSATTLALFTNNSDRLLIASTGTVTLNAPSSGTALTIAAGTGTGATQGQCLTLNGAASAATRPMVINASSTTGQSNGLLINAGTNASDFPLVIDNQSGATNFLVMDGTGGITVGNSVTGGSQGLGTLNANGLFVNGNAAAILNVAGGLTLAPSSSNALGVTPHSGSVGIVVSGAGSASGIQVTGTATVTGAIDIQAGGNSSIGLSLSNPSSLTTLKAFLFAPAYYTTGATTPTLGTNKPGAAAGAPQQWLVVSANGTAGWIPIWA